MPLQLLLDSEVRGVWPSRRRCVNHQCSQLCEMSPQILVRAFKDLGQLENCAVVVPVPRMQHGPVWDMRELLREKIKPWLRDQQSPNNKVWGRQCRFAVVGSAVGSAFRELCSCRGNEGHRI